MSKFEYPRRDFGKDKDERQRMSDKLKAPGDHSFIYEKRPELYGGEVPTYKNAEVIEEPAPGTPAEEHEAATELTETQVGSIVSIIKRHHGDDLDIDDDEVTARDALRRWLYPLRVWKPGGKRKRE